MGSLQGQCVHFKVAQYLQYLLRVKGCVTAMLSDVLLLSPHCATAAAVLCVVVSCCLCVFTPHFVFSRSRRRGDRAASSVSDYVSVSVRMWFKRVCWNGALGKEAFHAPSRLYLLVL